MRGLSLALVIMAYTMSSFGMAFATDWTVNRVSRIAIYSTDGSSWTRLARGMKIPGRSWIVTQRGARVQVSRGRDVVLVNPNTQVFLASTPKTHGKARLTLPKGVVTMRVRKGRKKRVSVLTPHLTAVVKGTTLTVGAKGRDSYVSVKSGRVGVTSKANGRSVDVTAGQSVTGRAVSSGKAAGMSSGSSRTAGNSKSNEPGGPASGSSFSRSGKSVTSGGGSTGGGAEDESDTDTEGSGGNGGNGNNGGPSGPSGGGGNGSQGDDDSDDDDDGDGDDDNGDDNGDDDDGDDDHD
ncbi:MAG: FecR family protein [Pseudomonadota bacterium]